MLYKQVIVGESERGFLFCGGTFRRFLRPGSYRFWFFRRRDEVRVASLINPRLEFNDAEFLARHAEVEPEIHSMRLKDHERGLVFKDGAFASFLGPGFHAFLKSPAASYTFEVVDIRDLEVEHPLRDTLVRAPGSAQHIHLIEVPDGQQGLLLVDQIQTRMLGPGRYYFWLGLKEVKVVLVELREQTLEVQGQELMTRDKVTLRVNLSVRWKVVDARAAVSSHTDFREPFYRELQLALRDEVGGRTLDELLEHKEAVSQAITARVKAGPGAAGIVLISAGLRDIILPGEMRTILNAVIEAEKRAQANLIARREETAATRNLLNTAKLLENNPLLMRLKEIESAERIAEKIGNLSVYGGIDGLLAALQKTVSLTVKK